MSSRNNYKINAIQEANEGALRKHYSPFNVCEFTFTEFIELLKQGDISSKVIQNYTAKISNDSGEIFELSCKEINIDADIKCHVCDMPLKMGDVVFVTEHKDSYGRTLSYSRCKFPEHTIRNFQIAKKLVEKFFKQFKGGRPIGTKII